MSERAARRDAGKSGNLGLFLAVGAALIAAVVSLAVLPASCSPEAVGHAREAAEIGAMVEQRRARQDVALEEVPRALEEAMAASPDVCAWVAVPGTNVSLPVLQSADGDDRAYGSRSLDGESDVLGEAFIERANSPLFIDPVTVVYGHAFDDAPNVAMGQLHLFRDEEFFASHDAFYVNLPDRALEYRIMGAYEVAGEHVLSLLQLGGEGSLERYFRYLAKPPGVAAPFRRNVGALDPDADRVVELSTCTMPASAEYRYVVVGLLVGEESLPGDRRASE